MELIAVFGLHGERTHLHGLELPSVTPGAKLAGHRHWPQSYGVPRTPTIMSATTIGCLDAGATIALRAQHVVQLVEVFFVAELVTAVGDGDVAVACRPDWSVLRPLPHRRTPLPGR